MKIYVFGERYKSVDLRSWAPGSRQRGTSTEASCSYSKMEPGRAKPAERQFQWPPAGLIGRKAGVWQCIWNAERTVTDNTFSHFSLFLLFLLFSCFLHLPLFRPYSISSSHKHCLTFGPKECSTPCSEIINYFQSNSRSFILAIPLLLKYQRTCFALCVQLYVLDFSFLPISCTNTSCFLIPRN